MKKKMTLATIILLAITVALAACGFTGLQILREEAAAAASPYAAFSENYAFYTAECEAFVARGEKAVQDIENYAIQIESNSALMTTLGGDATKIDELGVSAREQLTTAQAELESMKSSLEKLHTAAEGITEESDAETMDDAISKISKRRNGVERSLKKITKVDESEATKSCETIAAQACEESASIIAESYPEEDLSTQFAASAYEAESVTKEDVTSNAFADAWQYFFWLAGCALLAAVLCLLGAVKPRALEKVGAFSKKNMMLVALVGITLIFSVFTDYTILSPTNVSNIISQNAYIIILACGMLLCIVCSSNIDLSVGRVMGFIGACAAKFMIDGKLPTSVSIILCLLIGIAIGAWQGFWIAYMRIPAFIVTLAGQLTFYGLTMMILHGFTIAGFPDAYQTMFCSYINSATITWAVGIIAAAIFVFLQIRNRMQRKSKGYTLDPLPAMIIRTAIIAGVVVWLFAWLAKAKGIPTVLITIGIVLLVYAYITSKTVMGRHLYAMGGNVNAARLSGVKTQKMLFLSYVNMGFLAALAGLVYASRLNAASPQAGAGDELYAIASCYIGGASAYGGIGTVGGTLIGALTMGVIKNGMSIMGLGQDIQQIVLGLVLLTAIVIDVVSKQKISLPFLQKGFGKKKKA